MNDAIASDADQDWMPKYIDILNLNDCLICLPVLKRFHSFIRSKNQIVSILMHFLWFIFKEK